MNMNSSANGVWEWYNEYTDKWTPYERETNEEIEEAYRFDNEGNVELTRGSFFSREPPSVHDYKIFFAPMLQINITNTNYHKVRRQISDTIPVITPAVTVAKAATEVTEKVSTLSPLSMAIPSDVAHFHIHTSSAHFQCSLACFQNKAIQFGYDRLHNRHCIRVIAPHFAKVFFADCIDRSPNQSSVTNIIGFTKFREECRVELELSTAMYRTRFRHYLQRCQDAKNSKKIAVFIRGICQVFCVNISPFESVHVLQQLIYDRTGMSAQAQRLSYIGKRLHCNGEKTLAECGITESGCVVNLTVPLSSNRSRPTVAISAPDGKVLKLPFTINTTVRNLLNRISVEYPRYRAPPPMDIHLRCGGTTLGENTAVITIPKSKNSRIEIVYSDTASLLTTLRHIRIEICVANSATDPPRIDTRSGLILAEQSLRDKSSSSSSDHCRVSNRPRHSVRHLNRDNRPPPVVDDNGDNDDDDGEPPPFLRQLSIGNIETHNHYHSQNRSPPPPPPLRTTMDGYKILFEDSGDGDYLRRSADNNVRQLAMDLFFNCRLSAMWQHLPSVYHTTDCYPVQMSLAIHHYSGDKSSKLTKQLIQIYSHCFKESGDESGDIYPMLCNLLLSFWAKCEWTENIKDLKRYRERRPETLVIRFILPNRSVAFNANNARYHFYWHSQLTNGYDRPQLYRITDNRNQICTHSCDLPPKKKEITLERLIDRIFVDQQSITIAKHKSMNTIDPNTDLWFLTHNNRPFFEISLQSKPNLSGDELAIRPLISKDSSGGNCSICFDPLTAIGLSVVDEKEECDEKTQCDDDTDNDDDDDDETEESETGYARLSHCTHMFHWECIRKYLRQRRDNRCPLCRTQFTVVQTRPYNGALKTHKVSDIIGRNSRRQFRIQLLRLAAGGIADETIDVNELGGDVDILQFFRQMLRRLPDANEAGANGGNDNNNGNNDINNADRLNLAELLRLQQSSTVNCDRCEIGVNLVESNSYINCAHCSRFYHNQCFNADDFIQCAHCSVLIHRNCVGTAAHWQQTGNGQWQHTHSENN